MGQWYGGLPPHQPLTEYLNSNNLQDADFNTPSAEIFKELSWLLIVKRLKYNNAVFTCKAMNNLIPQYMEFEAHNRTLRSSVDGALAVPRSRYSLLDRSYSYIAPKLWNSIPIPIRNASSLISFKDRIKSIL